MGGCTSSNAMPSRAPEATESAANDAMPRLLPQRDQGSQSFQVLHDQTKTADAAPAAETATRIESLEIATSEDLPAVPERAQQMHGDSANASPESSATAKPAAEAHHDPINYVLDELPSDYPIFVNWKRYTFDLSSFLVGGVVLMVVLSVNLVLIILFLAVGCACFGCLKRCACGKKIFEAGRSWIFESCHRYEPSLPKSRRWRVLQNYLSQVSSFVRYIANGQDMMITLFVTMLLGLTLMYFYYGHPHENNNVSPIESLSPFLMYVVLMLIQAAKKQGVEAEDKAKEELTKIFKYNDDDLRYEIQRIVQPEGELPGKQRIHRIDAKLLENTLMKYWDLATQSDRKNLIDFLNEEDTFYETDDFWNVLRAMYPAVFRDENVGELIRKVDEKKKKNPHIQAEADNPRQDELSPLTSNSTEDPKPSKWSERSAIFPEKSMASDLLEASQDLQPWFPTKAKYVLLVGIHALIPPVWMALMHPASFTQEIWSFRPGVHDNNSSLYGLTYTDADGHERLHLGAWTPEKWVILIVFTSVIVQWLVVFNFLKYLDEMCLEYQQCRQKLLIFRATTEIGFASLSKEDQARFTEEDADLRICVKIENVDETWGANVARDLRNIQAKFCTEKEKHDNMFVVLPYHFAPSRMFRPTGTCIWWKFRHCLKVSITGKKVNLEIALSITFGLVLGLVCAAISSVFLQKTFTVSTVLAFYDLIVMQAFMLPAINACVFLGDFLKSDSELIDTAISRLDVWNNLGRVEEIRKKDEVKVCKTLLEYMKSKIDKHEKRPELFGFEITPEFRSRFMTVGGLGAVGTLVKAGKHYLSKLMTEVAATTAEEAAKKHKIKDAKRYGTYAQAAVAKVANGRRMLRAKISAMNAAEIFDSSEILPSVARLAATVAGLGISSTSRNVSAFGSLT